MRAGRLGARDYVDGRGRGSGELASRRGSLCRWVSLGQVVPSGHRMALGVETLLDGEAWRPGWSHVSPSGGLDPRPR